MGNKTSNYHILVGDPYFRPHYFRRYRDFFLSRTPDRATKQGTIGARLFTLCVNFIGVIAFWIFLDSLPKAEVQLFGDGIYML